jgi:putative redox protein
MPAKRVTFENRSGQTLVGLLDLPEDKDTSVYALFAHCFTCGKNLKPIVNINKTLADYGIGVLRFDFTGIGESQGDFSETSFSSNVEDLEAAADFLTAQYQAPALLIGHSMGGAAVLQAAGKIDSARAVITIAAPSSPNHLSNILEEKRDMAKSEGAAEVTIGGRTFTLTKEFFDDLEAQKMRDTIGNLNLPLLILHSPKDQTVDIENADEIFQAARQPKSYISLDKIGHLMLEEEDAEYVGNLIGSWVQHYL